MLDKMNLADAYYLVFKDLTKDEGLFTGVYDAKHGNPDVVYGIGIVMQHIACEVGDDCYEAFCDKFCENMQKSEERFKQTDCGWGKPE